MVWFFGYFHLKKWGAQPKFCLTIRFLALKPCLSTKKRSPHDYFLVLFYLYLTDFLELQFPIFLFFGIVAAQFFFWMLLTFFLEMFYKKHNIVFVGRGKKGSCGFFKKTVLFLKKERKHKN